MPKTICAKIVNEADLHSKHISQKESDREIGRLKKMVKKAKQKRKDREIEDAKN